MIAELFELRRLLATVANNVNQLAKTANISGEIPARASGWRRRWATSTRSWSRCASGRERGGDPERDAGAATPGGCCSTSWGRGNGRSIRIRTWWRARRRRCGSRASGCWASGDAGGARAVPGSSRASEFGTRVEIAERDGEGRVIGSRDAHVWHCSLSLHPDEPDLPDERWAEVCEEFVAAMGFAGADARAQCRWVAIRHGESAGGSDHAHIVVGLVAEDGSKASVHNDRPRAQQAARGLEERFGLRRLEARTRGTGSRGIRPGERMADTRRNRDHGPEGHQPEQGSRQTLERIVRGCATASRNESEFVRALREHGVRVRPRYAEGGRTKGGRLLGPPARARQRFRIGRCGSAAGAWRAISPFPHCARAGNRTPASRPPRSRSGARQTSTPARSENERRAEVRERALAWHQCVAEIERLRGQLRGVDNDPAGAARVARDGAGVLAAWSLALEGDAPGPLARAARQLARSAEHPAHRRTPPPRARPRSSALALFLLAGARPDSTAGWFLLARQLSLLGSDLARLHQLRGELDRAREIEAGLGAELELVRTGLAAEPRRGHAGGARGGRCASSGPRPDSRPTAGRAELRPGRRGGPPLVRCHPPSPAATALMPDAERAIVGYGRIRRADR